MYDYIDGTLTESVSQDIDRHIDECSKCAKHHQNITQNIALLKELPKLETPDMWTSIHEKIMEEEQASSLAVLWNHFKTISQPYAVPVASCALILIVSGVLLSRGMLASKDTVIDVQFRTTQEIAFYIREHNLPDNSATFHGEFETLSITTENGV